MPQITDFIQYTYHILLSTATLNRPQLREFKLTFISTFKY